MQLMKRQEQEVPSPAGAFRQDGFVLARQALTPADLAPVDALLLSEIRRVVPGATGLQDPDWIAQASADPSAVTTVYDAVRDHDLLLALGRSDPLTQLVRSVIPDPVLYRKVPLRIDVPMETKELAYWHQDDFYVKGNDAEVTVWIPLQDTFGHTGALSVMPRSHAGGRIAHTFRVGKKTIPTDIFGNEIRVVEMQRGDALMFSSFLVHSSNLNLSDSIRYSIQLRYASAGAGPLSDRMNGHVDV